MNMCNMMYCGLLLIHTDVSIVKVITSTLFIIVSQDREERMNVVGAPASIFPHTYSDDHWPLWSGEDYSVM